MRERGPFVDLCHALVRELGVEDGLRAIRVMTSVTGRERVYHHERVPAEVFSEPLRVAVTNGTSLRQAARHFGIPPSTACRLAKRWPVLP